jgi:hypothetical protein
VLHQLQLEEAKVLGRVLAPVVVLLPE